MKLFNLLDPIERSFFDLVLSRCDEADREVLQEQMGRINKVARYHDPSRGESQTILYWKGLFRVRRDFPVIFPSDRAQDRVAEAVAVVSAERAQVTLWMLTGAIAWFSFKPRRIAVTNTPSPNFENLQLFPDREVEGTSFEDLLPRPSVYR